MTDAEMIAEIRKACHLWDDDKIDDRGALALIEWVLDTNERNARNVEHQAAFGV